MLTCGDGGGIMQQLILFNNPLSEVGVNEFVKLIKESLKGIGYLAVIMTRGIGSCSNKKN